MHSRGWLQRPLILQIASWNKPFEVITDANKIAIGVDPQQDGRPVAHLSKKFDNAQHNYTIDKELFVVISTLKRWNRFLYGQDFVVKIDY